MRMNHRPAQSGIAGSSAPDRPLSFDAAPGSTAPIRLSVIVPVRNDPDNLRQCLRALQRSRFEGRDGSQGDAASSNGHPLDTSPARPPEPDALAAAGVEVIVADDASTDHTVAVAESMGVRVVRLAAQAGPAAARNAAAQVARGAILLFVDADVLVHDDTVAVAIAAFDDPAVDAVFGSYDLHPGAPNLLSQYKNLAHRFYHQTAGEAATTFWSGCGAVRREVFLRCGGFDVHHYPRPSIEDIDLGTRLAGAGRLIRIEKRMQATHLKRWTLGRIVRSDLFDRGIPWTRLILRCRNLPADLNLAPAQRIAALLAGLAVVGLAVAGCFRPWLLTAPILVFGTIALCDRLCCNRLAGGGIIALAAGLTAYGGLWSLAVALPLAGMLALNQRYYRFFLRHRGPLFTAAVVPMQMLYYLYSALALLIGTWQHWQAGTEAQQASPAATTMT